MLRRANTGLHRQCLSHHPLSQRLQNPSHRCPYSSLSERESRSRIGNSRNPSSSSKPKDNDATPAHASTVARAPTSPMAVLVRCGLSLGPYPTILLSNRLLPVMSIPEASSSNNQSTETEPSSSSTTTDRNTNRSASEHRQSRHPPRLPTVWRGHAHIHTTGRKTLGCRFAGYPWR
jgi:hypothetical protein